MDLFVFEQSTYGFGSVVIGNAQMINGLDSVMWIERYLPSGEFTLTGKVSKGYKEQLPVGALISHTGTSELMIVENHEISDDGTSESVITITGRSLESYLEQRIISAHGLFDAFPIPPNQAINSLYMSPADTAWNHARDLIEKHVYAPFWWAADAVDNLRAAVSVTGLPIVNTVRDVKLGELYKTVLELLGQDGCGIRSVRPGPWTAAYAGAGPVGAFFRETDFGFEIHNGVDRRNEVSFSWSEGDIKSGQYLWTKKNKKTHVLVQSKLYRVKVNDGSGATGLAERWGYVDATDFDDSGGYTPAETLMLARGAAYLASQKDINITRIELKENNTRHSYRQDYNVGDIVAVNGNYNTDAVMRVTEFVEIQDSTGYSGYPTLEAIA